MSDNEPRLNRANSLQCLRVDNTMSPIKALIRSNTVAEFIFPHVTLPDRYMVFSKLRENWDPTDKNQNAESRLHLSKLAEIPNLCRMEFAQDEMLYVDMDEKENKKFKEEEIMARKELMTKKKQRKIDTVAKITPGTFIHITKDTEENPKESDTSLLSESSPTDYSSFKQFLENYSPEPKQSYEDICRVYIKEGIRKLLLDKNVPFKNVPLETHTDSNEVGLKVMETDVISSTGSGTGSAQKKTGPIGKMCLAITQKESPTSDALQAEMSMKESTKLTSPTTTGFVQSTGAIRKTPTKIWQPKVATNVTSHHMLAKTSSKTKSEEETAFDYAVMKKEVPMKSLPTITRSAQLTPDSVTRVPGKVFGYKKMLSKATSYSQMFNLRATSQKQKLQCRSEGKNKRSPSVTTGITRNTSPLCSEVLPVHKLSKIPVHQSVSTGKVDNVMVLGPNVGEGSSSTKFLSGNIVSREAIGKGDTKLTTLTGIKSSADDETASKSLTFIHGTSLFGANPNTGEKVCIVEDICDIDETRSMIKLFLDCMSQRIKDNDSG